MNEFTLPDWVQTVKTLWGLVGAILVATGVDIAFLSEDFFTVGYLDLILGGITTLIGAGLSFYNVVKRGVVRPGAVVSQSSMTVTAEQKASFWLPFGRKYAISA
jgi:uncharacterized membrane protein